MQQSARAGRPAHSRRRYPYPAIEIGDVSLPTAPRTWQWNPPSAHEGLKAALDALMPEHWPTLVRIPGALVIALNFGRTTQLS